MKISVAKGKTLPIGALSKIRKKPGSSNAGKYKGVDPSKFIGAAGGASKFSYPANTIKRAQAAKRYAHNAPNPEGIIRAADRRIAQLRKKKRGKKNG